MNSIRSRMRIEIREANSKIWLKVELDKSSLLQIKTGINHLGSKGSVAECRMQWIRKLRNKIAEYKMILDLTKVAH